MPISINTSTIPHVTVIVAFFNAEKFLQDTIESVLQQDYTDWELLLVDDGSTDTGSEIAKRYAALHQRKISYIEHSGHVNKGVCASRNAGIRQAKGVLIAFLDADDIWLPEKLSGQVKIFQQEPAISMVVEASEYWYSWEEGSDRDDKVIPIGAPQDRSYGPTELVNYLYPLSTGAAPCPSGIMITKEALCRIGGFEELFTKEYQLYEDQAFLMKVYLTEQVYISSACQNKYRQHKDSCVQQVHADGSYHKVRGFYLKWLKNHLNEAQIEDKNIRRQLDRAIAPYRYPQRHFLVTTLTTEVKRIVKKGFKKLSQ